MSKRKRKMTDEELNAFRANVGARIGRLPRKPAKDGGEKRRAQMAKARAHRWPEKASTPEAAAAAPVTVPLMPEPPVPAV